MPKFEEASSPREGMQVGGLGAPCGLPSARRKILSEGTFLVHADLSSLRDGFYVRRLTSPHTAVPIQAPILPGKKLRLRVIK